MKSLSEQRVDRVARALCYAAATDVQPVCPICQEHGGKCTQWEYFQREATFAVAAMKGK